MRYFFDTEFIEDGKTIDLISIGLVAEDGRELYLLNYDCDYDKASNWVKKNVLAHLPPLPLPQLHASAKAFKASEAGRQGWRNKGAIADEIKAFCDPEKYGKPEFWAYYADYDWVVFCQLFGTMMDLPEGFPMYCRDLKQFMDERSLSYPAQSSEEHHALNDARWVRDAVYAFLGPEVSQ